MQPVSNPDHIDESNTSPYSRYHNPAQPLKRPWYLKIFHWIVQFSLAFILYYFASHSTRNISYITLYALNPALLIEQFPISLWFGLWWAFLLIKIFDRVPTLLGVCAGEWVYELIFSHHIQFSLIVIVGWSSLMISLPTYKGGEYYKNPALKSQFSSYGLTLLGSILIGFWGYQFQPNPILNGHTLLQARLYLILNIFVHLVIILALHWITFFILDRLLLPFFPISEEEQKIIAEFTKSELEEEEEKEELESLPQIKPGELYLNILTHHPVYEDDHTFVVKMGKIRIYLCSRCSGMVLGALYSYFLTFLLFIDLNLSYNQTITFWIGILLPILPLLDWGLQALGIRGATTWSRLVTGFTLGSSMQLISLSPSYITPMLIIIGIYMGIFIILMWIRSKNRQKRFFTNDKI